MKIRLAILDADAMYTQKLVSFLNANYLNDFAVAVYESAQKLEQDLEQERFDLLMAAPGLWTAPLTLPKDTTLLLLSETADTVEIGGVPTVSKYQAAESLVTELRHHYELTHHTTVFRGNTNGTRAIAFTGACGGSGCSTIAVGYAQRLALQGNIVVYLDLQPYGDSTLLLEGEGGHTLSDVLFAATNRMQNLSLQLEKLCGCAAGNEKLWYYAPFLPAADALDVKPDIAQEIVKALLYSDRIRYIVIDMGSGNFALQKALFPYADRIVWTAGCGAMAQKKLARALEIMRTVDDLDETNHISRSRIFLNFAPQQSEPETRRYGVDIAAQCPRLKGNEAQIVHCLAHSDLFRSLNEW